MNTNRYLTDNYAPVTEEITTTHLRVTGAIPRELNGRYLRNGPNPLGPIDAAKHHWFTGDGMVHGVRLSSGRAQWYRNRWVRSPTVVEALGEDLAGRELVSGNNTHVIGHAGRTWALVEAGSPPVELTDELDTLGVNAFFGTLTDRGFTAHPKVDPDTGDLHAVCYHWPDWADHLQYVHVGRNGRVVRTVNIPVPGMTMVHDVSLTPNYVVVYDLPVTINLEMAMAGSNFPFAWNNDYQPRVGLVAAQRRSERHRLGRGRRVLRLPSDERVRRRRRSRRDRRVPLSADVRSRPHRSVRRQSRDARSLDDRSEDAPRERTTHRRSRAGVSAFQSERCPRSRIDSVTASPCVGNGFPSILKHDLQTGASTSFEFGAGRHGAEPYFVAREGAKAEDDGYLMTFVYDEASRKSELVVLNAQDLVGAADCDACICRRACRTDSTAAGFPTARAGRASEARWRCIRFDSEFSCRACRWAIGPKARGTSKRSVIPRCSCRIIFPRSLWDPTTMLGGVAAVTRTLRVGTLVYGIDYRHPVIYARQAATLQAMSGGRHEFGIGAGWMIDDYDGPACSTTSRACASNASKRR